MTHRTFSTSATLLPRGVLLVNYPFTMVGCQLAVSAHLLRALFHQIRRRQHASATTPGDTPHAAARQPRSPCHCSGFQMITRIAEQSGRSVIEVACSSLAPSRVRGLSTTHLIMVTSRMVRLFIAPAFAAHRPYRGRPNQQQVKKSSLPQHITSIRCGEDSATTDRNG